MAELPSLLYIRYYALKTVKQTEITTAKRDQTPFPQQPNHKPAPMPPSISSCQYLTSAAVLPSAQRDLLPFHGDFPSCPAPQPGLKKGGLAAAGVASRFGREETLRQALPKGAGAGRRGGFGASRGDGGFGSEGRVEAGGAGQGAGVGVT